MSDEQSQAKAPGEEGGGVGEEFTADVTEEPTAQTTEPQAIDYAALERDITAMGDGYTLENIPQKMADMKKGMNTAQTELAKLKKDYEQFKPLRERIQSDPNYAKALEEATKTYFDQGYYQGDTTGSIPQDVLQQFNPIMQEIYDVKNKLASREQQEAIKSLRDSGMPIDSETESFIYNRIIDTGHGSPEDIEAYAWQYLGPRMVEQAGKSAVKQTVEKIQENNSKYVAPGSGQATESKPFDVTAVTQEEADNALLSELEEKMK